MNRLHVSDECTVKWRVWCVACALVPSVGDRLGVERTCVLIILVVIGGCNTSGVIRFLMLQSQTRAELYMSSCTQPSCGCQADHPCHAPRRPSRALLRARGSAPAATDRPSAISRRFIVDNTYTSNVVGFYHKSLQVTTPQYCLLLFLQAATPSGAHTCYSLSAR